MIDLRELFEERSAAVPSLSRMRVEAVRRRIAARRRLRRQGFTACTAVVMLVFIGYVMTPHRGGDPRLDDLAVPRYVDGFPEYSGGTRIAVSAAGDAAAGDLNLIWTPTTLALTFFVGCDGMSLADRDATQLRVNGVAVGGCGGITLSSAASALEVAGVDLGESTRFSLAVVRKPAFTSADAGAVPPAGRLRLGIAVPVPFEEYPLPPRPLALTGLPELGARYEEFNPGVPVPVLGSGGEPRRARSTTMTWSRMFMIQAASQTPGELDILFDGVPVGTAGFWDYHSEVWTMVSVEWKEWNDFPAGVGDTVTVTVKPRHVTGDWVVKITPY